MWERFSYYGMRALLVLYLVRAFGMDRPNALGIYAVYTGLVYLTPLIGGRLADRFLGQRKAVFIGGILMALGQFALTSPDLLNLGLGLLILGNGFFKPNISTMVGTLYPAGDARRDGAYTIFYMGINLGAFLAPLICGPLGERVGWGYGFATAGIGMVLGLLTFVFTQRLLQGSGLPPGRAKDYHAVAQCARLGRHRDLGGGRRRLCLRRAADLAEPEPALVADVAGRRARAGGDRAFARAVEGDGADRAAVAVPLADRAAQVARSRLTLLTSR